MAKDPAFLLMYKDILVSCASWDADELGWYLRLLCHQADKPDGLPSGLEELAALAGVKFSSYERFRQCWKRTLQAKFQANAQGLLINEVQESGLKSRREFKQTQAQRGLVGYYIKKAKALPGISKEQISELAFSLFEVLSTENSKEDNEAAYKRTLSARGLCSSILVSGNANGNGITISFKEEGTGETIPEFIPQGPVPDMVARFRLLNPEYPFDQNTDFPPVREIAEKIRKWKSMPGRIEDFRTEIVDWWGKLYDHAIADSHLANYSLSQLNKHFQPLVQSYTNARSKPHKQSSRGSATPQTEHSGL